MAIRPSDWGPYGEPSLVVVYGDSSTGKSADALRTHPSAIFLGPPGAFKPATWLLGFQPYTITVSNLYDALKMLVDIVNGNAALPPERKRAAIVLDEFTILVRSTVMLMEDSGRWTVFSKKLGHDINDVRSIFGEVAKLVTRFCYWARNAGMHVMILGHEIEPFTDDSSGDFHPGGLSAGSKNQTKAFPYFGDEVYRARAGSTGAYWTGYCECIPGHDRYYQKTRINTLPTVGPLNTGEALRLAGYRLERAPGLEGMDDQVAAIVSSLSADRSDVQSEDFAKHRNEWAAKLLNSGAQIPHVRWMMQDAVDRIDIVRRKRKEEMAGLGVASVAGSGVFTAAAPKAAFSGGLALAMPAVPSAPVIPTITPPITEVAPAPLSLAPPSSSSSTPTPTTK